MRDEWLESSSAGRDLQVLGTLSMRQQCGSQGAFKTAKRANCILGFIQHITACQSKEVIPMLYLVLVQPPLKYHVQFCAPQCSGNVKILDIRAKEGIKTGKMP